MSTTDSQNPSLIRKFGLEFGIWLSLVMFWVSKEHPRCHMVTGQTEIKIGTFVDPVFETINFKRI